MPTINETNAKEFLSQNIAAARSHEVRLQGDAFAIVGEGKGLSSDDAAALIQYLSHRGFTRSDCELAIDNDKLSDDERSMLAGAIRSWHWASAPSSLK